MGYRSGGLPYSGAHSLPLDRPPERRRATELTRADLNGDGIEGSDLLIPASSPRRSRAYRLRVSNQSGEELWKRGAAAGARGLEAAISSRQRQDGAAAPASRQYPVRAEASYAYGRALCSVKNGTLRLTLAEQFGELQRKFRFRRRFMVLAEARKFADEVNRLAIRN